MTRCPGVIFVVGDTAHDGGNLVRRKGHVRQQLFRCAIPKSHVIALPLELAPAPDVMEISRRRHDLRVKPLTRRNAQRQMFDPQTVVEVVAVKSWATWS
jgi:hypothetical protein